MLVFAPFLGADEPRELADLVLLGVSMVVYEPK